MQRPELHVRPNLARTGFDIRLRNNLGVNFFTEAIFYIRPDDEEEPEPEQPQVPIEDEPEVMVDNVNHFHHGYPPIEIIYVGVNDEDMADIEI